LSNEKPGCRENNGVVIGDSSRVYLFGGYNGTSWLNDLWSFDIDSQRWTCIQESSDPRPPDDGNGALGDAPPRYGSVLNVRGCVPSRRFGYVSVVHNNKFVLYGGFDGSRWLNDMFEFDFNTRTWREIESRGTLPSVRSCPAWAKDDTHVYIQGGYDGVERKADFFACDLATYTWTEMPCLGTPPSPRYFHSCCLYGNKMFLYGGYSGNERLADMYAYDFETNHWSEVDCTHGDAPSGRSSLVAQVYENGLYIFGGYNGVTVLNDFYKFRLKPVSVPPPALINDLTRLINYPEFSDVTFLVERNEVHANRAILAVRSEYFKVMLYSGGMRESLQLSSTIDDGAVDKRIEINGISHSVFLKVLEYLYTDTVNDITLEAGIHLLIVSELFMLDRLKALCEDIIRRDINVDNVISILVASHQHNAPALKDIALEFILQNLNESTIMMGLTELKSEPDLLVEIIKRNSFTVQSSPTIREVVNPTSGPFGNGSEWGARR
jgi:leucine-zipper-like transcriptional regulator 1